MLAVVTDAVYLNGDDGQITWINTPRIPLHRRGVMVDRRPARIRGDERFDCAGGLIKFAGGAQILLGSAGVWREPVDQDSREIRWDQTGPTVLRLMSALRFLDRQADADGPGRIDLEVARASLSGDPADAMRRAQKLAGAGAGLTPAGDDFLGGLCFAYWHLARQWPERVPVGNGAVERIGLEASFATSLLSGTILGDLAAGHGPEPLHRFVNSVVRGDADRALAAAQRLIGIGSSTGSSMLAGAMAALLFALAPVGSGRPGATRAVWGD